ncbi:DUF1850 domain-containing protein [Marinobacter sp. DY40_1A1]|uniref:DUF1850 domain-containing protein n=1 Tax=Marinobacter sp. DY40_1A1 TaxID=2583229 RepID=UPI001905F45C|nr:DUF1850 domain-containing protein [Marinobacter sp. DY40_1A1]MBK1885649.1 DUF1850 domain-containing protein [Marinobacter sp. DY40_1A1]
MNKLALLLAGAFALAGNLQAAGLEISYYREGKLLACVSLEDKEFELSFIHSVSLTPVKDYYQLVESPAGELTINQTAEVFIAHGQGLPSLVNEPDAKSFKRRNGKFILEMDRGIGQLIVRTDQRFENRLYVGNRNINLNQWPDGGLLITPVSNCQP